MEASALPVTPVLGGLPLRESSPLLRMRSDEQLVSLFRRGSEEAFRVIHDRYHARLLAYTRQMMRSSRDDAEDALQEVFVRAYRGLRVDQREIALRPWLYRVAHNRCIDELRRPVAAPLAAVARGREADLDPSRQAEQREELNRLVSDIRRLPHQQRSALLMRELADMSYEELGCALGVSVPAIKSLLVRARVGLARAAEARDASCGLVQRQLALAHDQRQRPPALVRRHLRECASCQAFRREIRGTSRQVAALVPGGGLLTLLGRLLMHGGGGAAAGGGAAGGAATGGGAVASGAALSSTLLGSGVAHVASLAAAAALTAGGAVAIQPSLSFPAPHHHHRHLAADSAGTVASRPVRGGTSGSSPAAQAIGSAAVASAQAGTPVAASSGTALGSGVSAAGQHTAASALDTAGAAHRRGDPLLSSSPAAGAPATVLALLGVPVLTLPELAALTLPYGENGGARFGGASGGSGDGADPGGAPGAGSAPGGSDQAMGGSTSGSSNAAAAGGGTGSSGGSSSGVSAAGRQGTGASSGPGSGSGSGNAGTEGTGSGGSGAGSTTGGSAAGSGGGASASSGSSSGSAGTSGSGSGSTSSGSGASGSPGTATASPGASSGSGSGSSSTSGSSSSSSAATSPGTGS